MRTQLSIAFTAAVFMIIGCSESKTTSTESLVSPRVNLFADSINGLLDSASKCYDLALSDMYMGLKKEEVVLKYNKQCSLLQSHTSRLLDSLSLEFIKERRTKSEYDSFIFSRFNFAKIQKKADKLADFGVAFHFDQ